MIAGIENFSNTEDRLAAHGGQDSTGTMAAAGTPLGPFEVPEADLGRFRNEIMGSIEGLLGARQVSQQPLVDGLAARFMDTRSAGEPAGADTYSRRLLEDIVPHCVNMASPRALGHMSGWQPSWVRVVGEVVLALNQNLVKHEASRGLTLLERQVLGMFHRLVYERSEEFYRAHVQDPASTLGMMVAGSTVANVTALWLARNRAWEATGAGEVEQSGLSGVLGSAGHRAGVVIGSCLMHYSVDKAAGLLGLGTDQVVKVDVDRSGRLVPEAAGRAVSECRGRGDRIVALVGTAGTTDCGSIDPLSDLADLAAAEGIHFHVDAAWGTPLLFSRAHRWRLAGIDRADSVTLDGHKQLHLPAGSNLLLCRDPSAAKSIEKEAPYMLHRDSFDLGRRSLEGSRPACALYLHAALHLLGRQGYERLIDRRVAVAHAMARAIRERPEFELLAEPETNIVVYRHLPTWARTFGRNGDSAGFDLARVNEHNVRLQRVQDAAGETFVSRTSLGHTTRHAGVPVVALRAVITHPATGDDELRAVLEDQTRIGAALERAGTHR